MDICSLSSRLTVHNRVFSWWRCLLVYECVCVCVCVYLWIHVCENNIRLSGRSIIPDSFVGTIDYIFTTCNRLITTAVRNSVVYACFKFFCLFVHVFVSCDMRRVSTMCRAFAGVRHAERERTTQTHRQCAAQPPVLVRSPRHVRGPAGSFTCSWLAATYWHVQIIFHFFFSFFVIFILLWFTRP